MKKLKKICPICGKVIESLYESQLDYNFKAHLITCEKRQERKEKKK